MRASIMVGEIATPLTVCRLCGGFVVCIDLHVIYFVVPCYVTRLGTLSVLVSNLHVVEPKSGSWSPTALLIAALCVLDCLDNNTSRYRTMVST